jgi:hypothetical protein
MNDLGRKRECVLRMKIGQCVLIIVSRDSDAV